MSTHQNTQPHCCKTEKCEGKRYHSWALNCRFCKNDIFVECLRNQDGLRTKELLVFFGLMNKTQNENGSFNWETNNTNPNKVSTFIHMFNVDSPFGITCNVCFNKLAGRQNSSDTASQSNSNSIPAINIKPPDNKPKQNVLIDSKAPDSPSIIAEKEKYAIYVSKFHTTVGCSDIIGHITSKTDIKDCNLFTVTKLLKRKINPKNIHFVSFKISTADQLIYNTILDKNVWGPEFTAIPFDFNHPKKSKHPPKLRVRSKPIKNIPSMPNRRGEINTKSTGKKLPIKNSNKLEREHEPSIKKKWTKVSEASDYSQTTNVPVSNNNSDHSQHPALISYPPPPQIPYHYPMTYHHGGMNHLPVAAQNFQLLGNQLPQYRPYQNPWIFPPQPQWLPYY